MEVGKMQEWGVGMEESTYASRIIEREVRGVLMEGESLYFRNKKNLYFTFFHGICIILFYIFSAFRN